MIHLQDRKSDGYLISCQHTDASGQFGQFYASKKLAQR